MGLKRKFGGLFGKAILALLAVSIVPVVLIGWHVLRVDSRVLQNEISDKQRTVAHRLAYALSEEVNRHVQFFSVFAGLHADFADHPAMDEEDLSYLRHKNPHIVFLALLDKQGKTIYSTGDDASFHALADVKAIMQTGFEQQQEYIGPVLRVNGRLRMFLAFPVKEGWAADEQEQLLVAELDLENLEQLLASMAAPDMSAAILSSDGQIILSFNSSNKTAAALPGWGEFIAYAQPYLKEDASAKISLPKGGAVLVSQTPVRLLKWTVFVRQPANTTYTLLLESVFHSVWDIILILLAVALFIVAIGYWILIPIVRPLKRLHEVAIKFEREDNYTPTEKDLIIPNNEIGEFARVFLHMAEVLGERKRALLAAQKKLLVSNEELEQRVQQRTTELNEAMDELVKAERLSTIGQMASIISHEIRNPLAVISNATRLIKTIQPPTEPKLIKQFSIIEEEIQQANRIIGEVLGFARSRDLILSVIDLNSYLHDVLASFPVSYKIRLSEQLDPQSARLKIDVEEMKQALRNLISNAADMMPEGGTITVGTRVGKEAVCIYVADEGPGISAELKEKIFSPFFTTKARGTGLGLAVVQKAVHRHQGKLFVHNGPEKGAVFEIYLRIYNTLGDTHYG